MADAAGSSDARQYNAKSGVVVARTPLNFAPMIPSSARRTLIFLLLSILVFWAPDWLAPTAWEHDATYPLVPNLYQGLLLITGFWFGPALCKAMVAESLPRELMT